MTHPARLRMLGRLRQEGPATATTLARELGLNTGATSYHLRQLAQHGFVVEDAGRGNARDRWWKAAHESTRIDRNDLDESGREALDAFQQAVAIEHTAWLQRAMEERGRLSEGWRAASTLSDFGLRLTPRRTEELIAVLFDLVRGWEEADEDEDEVADVALVIHAFPRPGTLPTEPPTTTGPETSTEAASITEGERR
nr:helix-turn-helix domain-containing protein [Nocardioides panaciterrulae]